MLSMVFFLMEAALVAQPMNPLMPMGQSQVRHVSLRDLCPSDLFAKQKSPRRSPPATTTNPASAWCVNDTFNSGTVSFSFLAVQFTRTATPCPLA